LITLRELSLPDKHQTLVVTSNVPGNDVEDHADGAKRQEQLVERQVLDV
jgi:hypothetical protein